MAHLYGVSRAIEISLLAQTVPAILGVVLEGNATAMQGVDVAEGAARDKASISGHVWAGIASAIVAATTLVAFSAATGPAVVAAMSPYAVPFRLAAIASGLGGVMMGATIVHASATGAALSVGDATSPAVSKLVVRAVGLVALYPLYRALPEYAPNLAPALGATAGAIVQLRAIRARVAVRLPPFGQALRSAFRLLFTDRRIVLLRLLDQLGTNTPAFLASRFPPGTYVVYSYAHRFSLPLYVAANAVVTVMVPTLVRSRVQQGALAAVRETRATAEILTTYAVSLAAAGIGAVPLAAMLFLGAGRGATIPLSQVSLTASVLMLQASLSLPISVVGSYLWANRHFDVALNVTYINVLVAVGGSVLATFGGGPTGLACAQTASYVASFSATVFLLRRRGENAYSLGASKLARFGLTVAVSMAAAYVAALLGEWWSLGLAASAGLLCSVIALGPAEWTNVRRVLAKLSHRAAST